MKQKLRSKAPLGATLIILSSLFYGSYGVWTKLMGDNFGSFSQVAIRSLLIVAILFPIAAAKRQLKPIQWRRDRKWFLLLLIACTLIGAPLYYATLIVGVGLSSTLFYAGFMLSMFLFGWVFNQEPYTKDKLISTLLGLLGIYLIFSPTHEQFSILALFAGLLSGVAAGLDLVVSQKLPYSPSQTTILTWSASVVTCIPIALFLKDKVPPIGTSWLYLILFSASALAASWFSISGVKKISAGAAGMLGLLEIVFGVIFGMIFFSERPGFVIMMGISIIIIAAAIPYMKEYRQKNHLQT